MSASHTPTTDSTIRLRDGRTLGYTEVGKSDGFPIFYFHGHRSSRLEVRGWTEFATMLGGRLIALDWPADVVEVADQFGIERFAVDACDVVDGWASSLALSSLCSPLDGCSGIRCRPH